MSPTPLTPLYMWAGGKSRLIKHYAPVWPAGGASMPYVEPFFGGGGVYCWLTNQHPHIEASLGDINVELMGLLEEVRDNPEDLIREVGDQVRTYLALPDKASRKNWYYERRQEYWDDPTPARLYLLMRLGFNGVWQTCVDSHGLFGTPAGLLNHERSEQVFKPELIRAWSAALQGAAIHAGGYQDILLPEQPSLIYLDPPYRDSFTSYGTGFDDDDQKLLAAWVRDRHDDGHRVLLANRHVEGDPFFEDLLGDICDFHYFDVTYTAGRRKKTDDGFEAKPAVEFLAVTRV